MKHNNIIKTTFFLLLLVSLNSCSKDYLDSQPSTALSQENAVKSVSDIQLLMSGAINSLYANPTPNSNPIDFGQKSFDLQSDLMGEDMIIFSTAYGWFNSTYQYTGWQNASNGSKPDRAWTRNYSLIKSMNDIIAAIDKAQGDQATKEVLKGQALGLRALSYYNLINYMQQTYKGNENKPGVPIYTDTSTHQERGVVSRVYAQILTDLGAAETLLINKTITDVTSMKISVVQGLRARVALLMNDWSTAASYANKAYSGYTLMTPAQYKSGFNSITNPEWIWGSFIPNASSTGYGEFFSFMDASVLSYAQVGGQKLITTDLYDRIPVGDVRKTMFQQAGPLTPANGIYTSPISSAYNAPSAHIPLHCQIKFRFPSPGSFAGDNVYMRAAEMYLIEAEALARSGDETGAKNKLKTLISTRYPAYSIATLAGQSLINEILLQRRIELWGEGFRLSDIKRTNSGLSRPIGTGNHGLPFVDPIVYSLPDASPKFLMRIPQKEIDGNPFMTSGDQNP